MRVRHARHFGSIILIGGHGAVAPLPTLQITRYSAACCTGASSTSDTFGGDIGKL